MYILVCADLTLPQQLVQVAHAAHAAGSRWGCEITDNIIVCETLTTETLLGALNDARFDGDSARDGSDYLLVLEPDLDHRITAAAVRPCSGLERRAFRRWKLWTPSTSYAGVA